MKGLGRHVSTLAIVAVMATAVLGAAYTLWYEKLTLNSEITTGTLDVSWSVFNCLENEDAGEITGSNFDDGFVWVAKEVGSFVRSPLPLPQDELILTISGAYPGYAVDCKLDYKNLGTVPVHVEREFLDFDLDNDGEFDDLHIECTAVGIQQDCRNLDPLANPWESTTNPSPVYTRWVNGLGCQLHQNDRGSGDLFIGIRQPAAENATYRVRFTVQFNQWNESGWNNCAAPKTNPAQPVTVPDDAPRQNDDY